MTADDLVQLLAASNLTVTSVESCTGGMIAAAITDVAGSSAVFRYGYVTYANQAKIDLVGVRAQTIETHGAVSKQCVIEMAQGGLKHAGADISIAVSGIAGPSGGSAEKPEGLVWFALAQTGKATVTEHHVFTPLGRGNVRRAACHHALGMIARAAQSI